ncbi:hypothetical protein D3C71_1708200 [compost metagenome]
MHQVKQGLGPLTVNVKQDLDIHRVHMAIAVDTFHAYLFTATFVTTFNRRFVVTGTEWGFRWNAPSIEQRNL